MSPTANAGERSASDDVGSLDSGDTTVRSLDSGESLVVETGRWRGVEALAVGALGVALLVGTPSLILAGLAGVGFAAYARFWSPPDPRLDVDREVSDTEPVPGQRVEVRLQVTNAGDSTLTDLRFADDVSAGLRVVEGTPRHTTALRPDKSATIAYRVEAVRGEHTFDSVTAITRDVSGATERIGRVPTDPVTMCCRPAYDSRAPDHRDLPTLLAGRQDVSATGAGVTVHSVREYRSGDSLARIDWNRLASTGTLATREYEHPRRVRVVVVVDARNPAYVAVADDDHTRVAADGDDTRAADTDRGPPRPTVTDDGPRPAVDVCAHAAGELVTGLLDADAFVGLASLSPRSCWLPPSGGETHRERLLDAVTGHPAFDWAPPETGSESQDAMLDRLLARLDGTNQVVFCSPLFDDAAVQVARRLDAAGYAVTVCAPDVIGTDTPGTDSPFRAVAAVERDERLRALRAAGLSVYSWEPPADPTAGSGWSPCP